MVCRFISCALLFMLVSCGTTKINQYVKDGRVQQRHGKWVETNTSDLGNYLSLGKYRAGEKVGVWKTSLNGKLLQRDVYRKDLIKTKIFYPSGNLMQKGQSRTEIGDDVRHWFYFGAWKNYNTDGKLIYIKNYQKGQKFDSIAVRN